MKYFVCYNQIAGETLYPPLWVGGDNENGRDFIVLSGKYGRSGPGDKFDIGPRRETHTQRYARNKRFWTENIDHLPGEAAAFLMFRALKGEFTDDLQSPSLGAQPATGRPAPC